MRDVHALKRKVTIGVYFAITADLPLYFLLNYTFTEVAIMAVVGWLISGVTIQFAFGQIFKARKRGSYPALLMLEAGNVSASDQAAERSLKIIGDLIRPETAFLALLQKSGPRTSKSSVLAASGISPEAALDRLESYSEVLETAIDVHYPMEVPSEVGDIRVMIVPVVALKKTIGVLYLAGYRNNRDLGDKALLADIGAALGISLDNLRQREELLKKESRLGSLMMGAPVVLFAVDTNGITTYMQGQGVRRLGVTLENVVGQSISDTFGQYPQVMQGFRRCFAGEEVTSTATIDIQDKKIIFEYRLVPERDEMGRVVGIIGVATDISERKAAEEALHESQRALETLVSNLPGFAYRCRNEPGWPIEYISNGVEEVTGYSVTQYVAGELASDHAIHPDDRQIVREQVRAALETTDPYRLEYRIVTRWGEEKWVWEQGQGILSDDGDVLALEGFISDVTERKQAERRLAESEERFRDIFENARDLMFSSDFRGWMTSANERFLKIAGYTWEELRDMPTAVLIPQDLHQFAGEQTMRIFQGDTEPYEIDILTKSGERVPLEISARIVFDEKGRPVTLQGIGRDIRERKRAEQALEASEARYRALFENANDVIFTHGVHGTQERFQSINRKAEEVSGYTREELLGRTVWDVVAPEFHQIAHDHMQRLLGGDDPGPFELEVVAKDGHRIPMEVSQRVLFDDAGEAVLVQGIARDVSERRLAEETIRRLAYHDALTGLPNRALFEDRLDVALAQARRQEERLAVMFLDLDHFKVVNDTLGHNAGDRLLEAVAHDLSTIVRDGDTVARVGGDEFTLLLPSIERTEEATDIATRILDCLQQPRMLDGQEFRTTGSIGITTYPADGGDGDTLLRNADTAMYRAKERGRDNYQLYTRAMNERMLERLSFENDLRHALERGELTLFYQPIVDVQTGKLAGAEALVRWQHPEKGIVLPDDFIPFAEESGLIVDIGESVLREACEQIKVWQKAGLHMQRVAVNLSARQLQQEDLVSRIARILEETGVPPSLIQLEITEGAVLKSTDYIISTLNQLRDMGIGIALDDFGTGYSSLTYLKRFPIDTVKIDRTFVRDLETDASDATIVSTVIAMADNLRLKVIAEGVESENQLQFLRERGCDEFQGYLVSRPVPPDEFEKLAIVRAVPLVARNGRKTAARSTRR